MWGALIGAGASLLGGVLSGNSAKDAAKTSADAQLEAAKVAAQESRFRPVGITTGFGSSSFQMGAPKPTLEQFMPQPGTGGGGRTPGWGSGMMGGITSALQGAFPQGAGAGGGYSAGEGWDNQPQYTQPTAGVRNPMYNDLYMSPDQEWTTPPSAGGALMTPEQQYKEALAKWEAGQSDARLTGASYELTPEMKAIRDNLIGEAGAYDPSKQRAGAESLLDLGGQYLAKSPEEAAQQWMQAQQGLLQPSRDMAYSKAQQNLFGSGRGGLSIAQGGGLGEANPEMQAYYNALATQDATLAAQADEYGQQRTKFGAGLFNDAGGLLNSLYAPQATWLGHAAGVESLGQDSLKLGMQLGGYNANPTGAEAILRGGISAAQTAAPGNAYNPYGTALSSLSQNRGFQDYMGKLFTSPADTGGYNPAGAWASGEYNPNGMWGKG